MMTNGVLSDSNSSFINSLGLNQAKISVFSPIDDTDLVRFRISKNQKITFRAGDLQHGFLDGHGFGCVRFGSNDPRLLGIGATALR